MPISEPARTAGASGRIGNFRTGDEARRRSELNRSSASKARTSSCRVSSQPVFPSGNASLLTGFSSRRHRYSAGGSNGLVRRIGSDTGENDAEADTDIGTSPPIRPGHQFWSPSATTAKWGHITNGSVSYDSAPALPGIARPQAHCGEGE